MKKRNSIKPYEGGKITKFENFTGEKTPVKNRHMLSVLEGLEQRGISVSSVEEPAWGTDGLIELTEMTHLTLTTGRNNKKIRAGITLSDGHFELARPTEDLDEALKELGRLKLKYKTANTDYTSDSTAQQPTPFLRRQRAEKVGKAAELVENAIRELKHAPRLDEMSDIPELIAKLQQILGEDEELGLSNLHKLYESEK